MTRSLRWLVCLGIIASTLFANQLSSALTANDSADELAVLIARIETRYGPMRGLAADFEQSYSGAGVREKRERGRLFLQRPKRMRWEYEPKPGKLFIVNNRDVWLYVPADGEVVRADAAKVSDARFPFLFLLGQKNLRSQFSRISFASDDAGASSGVRTLSLTPKQKDAGIREIALEVTNDGQILKVRIAEEGGGVSEVWLKNVRENYIAPAEAFEFTPPAGVNVRRQN
jgi:outer membrane lipoprotein carrier protein